MSNCSLFIPVFVVALGLMSAGTFYFIRTLRHIRTQYNEYASHAPTDQELTQYQQWLEEQANLPPQEATTPEAQPQEPHQDNNGKIPKRYY